MRRADFDPRLRPHLERELATQKDFAIHYVPGDGDVFYMDIEKIVDELGFKGDDKRRLEEAIRKEPEVSVGDHM